MVVCNRSLPGGKKLPELSNPGDASDILSGVQFIDGDGEIVTGTMPTKGAQTYTPGTSNQTISSGRYLTGNQTIQGDSDLVPGNIRSGVNIFGVNGTYSGPALPSLSPAASAGQVLSGYQFINASGSRVTGTMPSLGSKTYTPGRTQQTISSGRYLSGNQYIEGDSNLTASNIRQGVRIFGVTGTYAGQSVDLSDYDLYYSYSCSGTSSNVITIRLNQSGFWPSDISFSDITVRSLWMGCLDLVSHGSVQCMAMPLTPEGMMGNTASAIFCTSDRAAEYTVQKGTSSSAWDCWYSWSGSSIRIALPTNTNNACYNWGGSSYWFIVGFAVN